MSHVDEGALHAYLDGALDEYPSAEAERIRAHLDACGACAERLEEERRVRSDAHAMLGFAAPAVELPSLEELRAYVQRTAQQRRGISRLHRMGWAASVVLALGAGWMLRGGQLQYGVSDFEGSAPAAEAAPAAAGPGSDAVSPQILARSSEGVARNAMGETAGEAGSASEGTRGSAVTSASLADVAEEGGEALFRANAPSASMVASAEVPAEAAGVPADVTDASAAADEELQKMAGPVATAMLTDAGVAPDSQSRQEQSAELEALTQRSVPVIVTSARSPVAAEPRADADAPERRAREASLSPPSVAVNAVEVEGVGGRGAASDAPSRSLVIERNEADDEAAVEPLLAVPGHEVVDVTNLGEGSTPWGARVRQRTDDGVDFEVFHLEPGIDPSILPPMEAGVGEASTETAFGWLLVRGALDDETLASLLLQLFPEVP